MSAELSDFVARMMDMGIEPDEALMATIVGPEIAAKRLVEWRAVAAARSAPDPGTVE